MTFLQAIFLGIVQGITEFFPISSSAHLKLAKELFSIQHDPFFDLVCHVGTLLSLICFLFQEILSVLKSFKKISLFFLALLPLIPCYFFLKPLREALSQSQYLGYTLMVTGVLLFLASKKKTLSDKKKWQHVLCIGAMQTAALIPGISRSGSTIATARFLGWSWKEAATFSFLLSVPAILGGLFLEIFKKQESLLSSDLSSYAAGFFSSFCMGLVGVRLIFWVYEKQKVRPIACYCLALGALVWAYFHG